MKKISTSSEKLEKKNWTKYQTEWEKENPWLKSVKGNNYEAFCKLCREKPFPVSTGGLSDVKQHSLTKLHRYMQRTEKAKEIGKYIKQEMYFFECLFKSAFFQLMLV
jgi:hypothetical protein